MAKEILAAAWDGVLPKETLRMEDLPQPRGRVFNIQRYSLDDGPGIRTTVFLKGCQLRCPWCSNPESQSFEPQILYRYTACKMCGACIAVCPQGAVTMGADGIDIDRARCAVCGECAAACVQGALKISGEDMTVEQVFKVIRRDAAYYEESGGGVTCSGGEILAQADFVRELFKKCREAGYHTCADTSGFGTAEAMEKVLKFADLVYFDLKHADDGWHLANLAVPRDVIIRNLRLCALRGVPVVIRVPLVPGQNDSEENLTAMAELAKSIVPRAQVNILPYHKYGESKYRSVGMEYTLSHLRENTPEELERAAAVFVECGLECTISK
ncbi:MAG: glycyl-radical enzyme activating protein [Oscillospiraceae bacterium]|jgi:pyruvate formate lyase activating enzyme|nr:glycyl-radical enzyme activating protein [Oscillospiraceae bacterium]